MLIEGESVQPQASLGAFDPRTVQGVSSSTSLFYVQLMKSVDDVKLTSCISYTIFMSFYTGSKNPLRLISVNASFTSSSFEVSLP